jgi:hypothetical protein
LGFPHADLPSGFIFLFEKDLFFGLWEYGDCRTLLEVYFGMGKRQDTSIIVLNHKGALVDMLSHLMECRDGLQPFAFANKLSFQQGTNLKNVFAFDQQLPRTD